MTTIVRHKATGERFVLLGAGYGAYKSARPHGLLGNVAPVEEGGTVRAVLVCDAEGVLSWIESAHLETVTIDGRSPRDALAREGRFDRDSVLHRGFDIATDVVSVALHKQLLTLFGDAGERPGMRIGLGAEAIQAAVTCQPVREIVGTILGSNAFAVKATLFDKQPESNWLVPWHQDVMVPVRERVAADGFDAWSEKDGVAHVRPPVSVLESMLAVRLDLDGSATTTGSLRVLPGTHVHGVLHDDQIRRMRDEGDDFDGQVAPLGALIMRPLLLHASSRARDPGHRRIVHLEFANCELPGGVQWFERLSVRA